MGLLRRACLAIALAALTVTLACGDESKGQELRVRGLVVEVRAASLTELSFLSVRDDRGTLWEFTAQGFAGLTPSHLREHQAFQQPVTVRYVETPDGLVAVSLTD